MTGTATTGWSEVGDHRVRAAGIARRLQRAAVRVQGFASSRVRVCLPGSAERRPAAVLVAGEPPVDGVVTQAPALVVEFAPADPAWWLQAGAVAVWVVGDAAVTVHTRDAPPRVLTPGSDAPVPGTGERVAVANLLA